MDKENNTMRGALVDDITVEELPVEREILAAQTMRRLLESFTPAVAVASALLYRGERRIIRAEDSNFFVLLCDKCGWPKAWSLALEAGFFHLDQPSLPGISFDLNAMSNKSCRDRFRFDHRGIKDLVVRMIIPDTIIVPKHGDRVTSVEAICLVLDRMAFPRKWSDLTQRYDRHESALSRIFNCMLHCILKAAKRRILLSGAATTAERLEMYTQAFHRRGYQTFSASGA